MWSYNYSDELCHFGVKGMKWGRRKNRDARKAEKKLKKDQKKWDKNVRENWHIAYNRAADESNAVLIPKLNKKYEKYDFSDLSDPKIKKVWDKYNKEYEDLFKELYSKKFKELFGDRPS